MKGPTSKTAAMLAPVLVTVLAISSLESQAADSTPRCTTCDLDTWPAPELAAYSKRQESLGYRPGNLQLYKTRQRPGPIIVGATEPLAIHAGFKVLEGGGSAADAAVATVLAQVALSAGSAVSYAGILDAMYFDAASGRVQSLNAGYNTLREETDPLTIPASEPSGRTVLVPGFMAGVEALHTRYGRLPFAELFEPRAGDLDCGAWRADEFCRARTNGRQLEHSIAPSGNSRRVLE